MTDMGMPVMDGFELCAALKRLKPELPIVISSGLGNSTSTLADQEGFCQTGE